ncbi:hypothetical protein ENBRE01_1150 [Enteropsectra breve]|nr:hypothetical protein ENBRE01_1150 [Enteropsectra breve]
MNNDALIPAINIISTILTVLPPLAGVGAGLKLATDGICRSVDYDLDLTFSIMPMAFTSAPAIYSLLLFFYMTTKSPKTLAGAIKCLGGTAIQGFACGYCGYVMGGIARDAAVARAKQKKFTSSYFLLLIFGELIGLLALVLGMLILSNAE